MIKKFKTGKIGKLLYRERFPLLASLCTFVLMGLVYFAYDVNPFGDNTVLRMDLYHQYGPLFAELYERIKNCDSLLYSWTSGGGGAFLGNFYNYLSSPFAVVMLIAGHKNMPDAIAVMILLKACTASFSFSHFLSHKFREESPITSAFGVLYACSGYFIAYYWNVMWLDAFYLFPLVMLGIEKLIKERKSKLFIISLTLTFITNYYMAYMVCIFSVFYFIYCYLCNFSITETYCGRLKKPEKGIFNFLAGIYDKGRNFKLTDCGFRFAFGAVGAAALSAFALIPVYFCLKSCSATSGTFPEEFKTYFSVFDFLANHLAYLDPTIRSSGTDVLPNVYCGILTVMLVPLFIFSEKVKNVEKVASVGILALMFASCYTNYLNYIWHGLHFPNDLPYRFSYMYSFLLLMLAFRAILLIKEYSKKQITGVGVATTFFVIIVQEIGSKNFSETGVWICVAFIGIYCLSLGILKNDKYPRVAAAVLILCSVCAEYLVSNTNNYEISQSKTNYVSDYDDFQKVKKAIDKNAGDSFYRMELTSLRARMDPCWYYYNGISAFSSMAYEKSANMQSDLGMFSNYINSYTYHRQTAVYNAFFSLDYIVDNSQTNTTLLNPKYYSELTSEGGFTAYKNNYSLPVAFRVNNKIKKWSHDDTNPFDVQSNLFYASTGLKDVFNDIEVTKVLKNNLSCNYAAYGNSGCYPFELDSENADGSLDFTMTIKESGNAYIYFKTGGKNVESITVTLSEDTAITQNIGSYPHILDLGYMNKGDTVSVHAPISDGTTGYTYLYGVTLNDEVFKKGYDMLKKDAVNFEEFDGTHIKGSLTASENGIIYTSINYDEGWTVYIDGKKAESRDIVKIGDALIGVKVKKGTHTLEMNYTPQGLTAGCAVSFVALLVILFIWYLTKKGLFDFEPELYTEEAENIPVLIIEEPEITISTDGLEEDIKKLLNGETEELPDIPESLDITSIPEITENPEDISEE